MDNLQSLFEKEQYDLIIKLTKDSTEYTERFLHLMSLVMLTRYDDALIDIETHREILEKGNLYKLIKMHFELLFELGLFDKARSELKHYESLPYDSQKVEELLHSLPKKINEEENPPSKTITLEEANNILLTSEDNAEISEVLFSLRNLNFKGYVSALKKVIVNEKIHPTLRTFGLIIFKDNDYDGEIEFLTSLHEVRKLNPKTLIAPFTSKTFFETRKCLEELGKKNVSLLQTSVQLLNNLVMDVYPDDIDFAIPTKLARAIYLLAKEAMNEKNLEEDEDIILIKNKIKEISSKIPSLVF